jgi:hypothetical protein
MTGLIGFSSGYHAMLSGFSGTPAKGFWHKADMVIALSDVRFRG